MTQQLSFEDYADAHAAVRKAVRRKKKGKKLSKKDRALITIAADAEGAHRTADLLRATTFPEVLTDADGETIAEVKKVPEEVVEKLRGFRDELNERVFEGAQASTRELTEVQLAVRRTSLSTTSLLRDVFIDKFADELMGQRRGE